MGSAPVNINPTSDIFITPIISFSQPTAVYLDISGGKLDSTQWPFSCYARGKPHRTSLISHPPRHPFHISYRLPFNLFIRRAEAEGTSGNILTPRLPISKPSCSALKFTLIDHDLPLSSPYFALHVTRRLLPIGRQNAISRVQSQVFASLSHWWLPLVMNVLCCRTSQKSCHWVLESFPSPGHVQLVSCRLREENTWPCFPASLWWKARCMKAVKEKMRLETVVNGHEIKIMRNTG